MAYRVELSPAARRDVQGVDSVHRNRIFAALIKLEGDPRPRGSKKLQGGGELWRVRVGDYRIVYEIQDSLLAVLVARVGHRRDVYR